MTQTDYRPQAARRTNLAMLVIVAGLVILLVVLLAPAVRGMTDDLRFGPECSTTESTATPC